MEFEQIYKKHYKEIYSFVLVMCCNESIAEEITQETFYKALKNIHRFRRECSLNTWLCQIAKNTYRSYLKKTENIVWKDSVEWSEFIEEKRLEDTLEEMVIRKNEVLSIYEVLKCLEEPYKEVFILRMLNELTFQEIGQIYGRKEGWARVTYYRAKQKIQAMIKKEE